MICYQKKAVRLHLDNQMVTTNILRKVYYARSMWNLVSFAQSRTRKICLLALSQGPKTPSAISASTGKNLSHISRALRELTEKGLVECLTPTMTKNKIYQITPEGCDVVEKLKIIDSSK